jgi:uncharacterized membrane protein
VRADGRDRRLLLPSVLAVATVLAQIAYPLSPDRWLGRLSVITVLAFAAASVTHAIAVRGAAWATRLVVVVVLGAYAAELLGRHTGFPFGHYTYAHSLGPLLAGVPILVPFAWLMMAYPCLLLGRLLCDQIGELNGAARLFVTALLAGGALAAWDIFLDPQMVAAGHWTWAHPSPGLPGIARVPLTNLAGWALAAIVLMAVTDQALPRDRDSEAAAATPPAVIVPAVLLTWTWLGSIVGNAVFFHRAGVALWGGLLLGLFVGPYLVSVRARWPG